MLVAFVLLHLLETIEVTWLANNRMPNYSFCDMNTESRRIHVIHTIIFYSHSTTFDEVSFYLCPVMTNTNLWSRRHFLFYISWKNDFPFIRFQLIGLTTWRFKYRLRHGHTVEATKEKKNKWMYKTIEPIRR